MKLIGKNPIQEVLPSDIIKLIIYFSCTKYTQSGDIQYDYKTFFNIMLLNKWFRALIKEEMEKSRSKTLSNFNASQKLMQDSGLFGNNLLMHNWTDNVKLDLSFRPINPIKYTSLERFFLWFEFNKEIFLSSKNKDPINQDFIDAFFSSGPSLTHEIFNLLNKEKHKQFLKELIAFFNITIFSGDSNISIEFNKLSFSFIDEGYPEIINDFRNSLKSGFSLDKYSKFLNLKFHNGKNFLHILILQFSLLMSEVEEDYDKLGEDLLKIFHSSSGCLYTKFSSLSEKLKEKVSVDRFSDHDPIKILNNISLNLPNIIGAINLCIVTHPELLNAEDDYGHTPLDYIAIYLNKYNYLSKYLVIPPYIIDDKVQSYMKNFSLHGIKDIIDFRGTEGNKKLLAFIKLMQENKLNIGYFEYNNVSQHLEDWKNFIKLFPESMQDGCTSYQSYDEETLYSIANKMKENNSINLYFPTSSSNLYTPLQYMLIFISKINNDYKNYEQVKEDSIYLISKLLQNGADINSIDINGENFSGNILHFMYRHFLINQSNFSCPQTYSFYTKIIQLLLKHRADLNYQNLFGQSLIMLCCSDPRDMLEFYDSDPIKDTYMLDIFTYIIYENKLLIKLGIKDIVGGNLFDYTHTSLLRFTVPIYESYDKLCYKFNIAISNYKILDYFGIVNNTTVNFMNDRKITYNIITNATEGQPKSDDIANLESSGILLMKIATESLNIHESLNLLKYPLFRIMLAKYFDQMGLYSNHSLSKISWDDIIMIPVVDSHQSDISYRNLFQTQSLKDYIDLYKISVINFDYKMLIKLHSLTHLLDSYKLVVYRDELALDLLTSVRNLYLNLNNVTTINHLLAYEFAIENTLLQLLNSGINLSVKNPEGKTFGDLVNEMTLEAPSSIAFPFYNHLMNVITHMSEEYLENCNKQDVQHNSKKLKTRGDPFRSL